MTPCPTNHRHVTTVGITFDGSQERPIVILTGSCRTCGQAVERRLAVRPALGYRDGWHTVTVDQKRDTA